MVAWGKRGSTRLWREKRLRVLRRDQYRCQLQLPGCTYRATTVHHKAAWHGKPEAVPDHLLEAACQHCNLAVGDPTRHDPQPTTKTTW